MGGNHSVPKRIFYLSPQPVANSAPEDNSSRNAIFLNSFNNRTPKLMLQQQNHYHHHHHYYQQAFSALRSKTSSSCSSGGERPTVPDPAERFGRRHPYSTKVIHTPQHPHGSISYRNVEEMRNTCRTYSEKRDNLGDLKADLGGKSLSGMDRIDLARTGNGKESSDSIKGKSLIWLDTISFWRRLLPHRVSNRRTTRARRQAYIRKYMSPDFSN